MSARPTYTAVCTRSDGWWAIEVPEVRGAFSQARRLEQVEEMAREVIALLLGVPEDSFDVTVTPQLPEEFDQTVTVVKQLREDAQRLEAAATEATRQATHELRHSQLQLAMRDIAWLLGISYQRVAQLINQSAEPKHPEDSQGGLESHDQHPRLRSGRA